MRSVPRGDQRGLDEAGPEQPDGRAADVQRRRELELWGESAGAMSGDRVALLDEQVRVLDRQLAVLGRREAGLRLRVGELLDALGGRFRELAFPSLGAYVRE